MIPFRKKSLHYSPIPDPVHYDDVDGVQSSRGSVPLSSSSDVPTNWDENEGEAHKSRDHNHALLKVSVILAVVLNIGSLIAYVILQRGLDHMCLNMNEPWRKYSYNESLILWFVCASSEFDLDI